MAITLEKILKILKKNNIKKFENDYWGASLKELVNKIDFEKNKKMKIATCGVSHYVPKYYLKKGSLLILRLADMKTQTI
mgnify:CR=1 FL=1